MVFARFIELSTDSIIIVDIIFTARKYLELFVKFAPMVKHVGNRGGL